MQLQENSTGRPLADVAWLENHHRAKLPERTAFAKRLATLNPKTVVDLGCATGLWFEILNGIMPNNCEFIGIDSDKEALDIAIKRSKSWNRKTSFLNLDIEKDVELIPTADLILAFNIFPYISNLDAFLSSISSKIPHGTLAVRQYDGASIRFGPMLTEDRQKMELELRVAVENSQKFHHYDLDRTFKTLQKLNYKNCDYSFELFERVSPFKQDFIPYYEGMLEWTYQHLSEMSANQLKKWISEGDLIQNRYFYEVDLVALLS